MTTENNENKTPEELAAEETARINALVAAKVEENLKEIKGKLDTAFGQRDEALRKLEEKKLAEQEAEKKRLFDEGKLKELAEMQLAEERAKREALEARNIELSRDVELRTALAGKDFKGERTTNIAFKEIVADLVKDDKGNWQHKSGVSISAFVEKFCADEENSFLFKVKANNGGGSTNSTNNTRQTSKPKSLFNLSQDEVLKMAEEGKL